MKTKKIKKTELDLGFLFSKIKRRSRKFSESEVKWAREYGTGVHFHHEPHINDCWQQIIIAICGYPFDGTYFDLGNDVKVRVLSLENKIEYLNGDQIHIEPIPSNLKNLMRGTFYKKYGIDISRKKMEFAYYFVQSITKAVDTVDWPAFHQALGISSAFEHKTNDIETKRVNDHLIFFSKDKEPIGLIEIPLTDYKLLEEDFIKWFIIDERTVDDVICTYIALKGYKSLINSDYDLRKYKRLNEIKS